MTKNQAKRLATSDLITATELSVNEILEFGVSKDAKYMLRNIRNACRLYTKKIERQSNGCEAVETVMVDKAALIYEIAISTTEIPVQLVDLFVEDLIRLVKHYKDPINH